MDLSILLKALIMGIVEGLTEFLPISSTGHLIIVGNALSFPEDIAATFEIFIQLGAILAVAVFFARDLIDLLRRAVHDRAAQRLLAGVVIAFVPAAAVGVLLIKYITQYLFSPFTVGIAMVLGALIILWVERAQKGHTPPVTEVEQVDYKQSLGIGIAQIASLFPGMSRSASTIVGGLLMGLDRPTAVRFSFYLSIPTMFTATLYDLVRNLDKVQGQYIPAFGVGLITAFFVALIVIRWFLHYVARHNLVPFAWYRLVVGAFMIVLYLPLPR